MAPSDLTHLHTAPDEHPAPRRGVPGAEPQTRDSVAQIEDVELARRRRTSSNPDRPRRTAHHVDRVSRLARQALVAPPRHSSPLRPSPPDDWAPQPLALHPFPRRRMERADRKWLLWWTPDDVRLGRPRRRRGTPVAGAADESRGDRVQAFRLLERMVGRTMAQHLAALSRLQLGPSRSW